jgi:uncharacterized protein YrzB (UPF0473 family)
MANVEFFEHTEENIVPLTDEAGNEVRFYQAACIESDGEFYALMQPAQNLPDISGDEAVIFKLTEDGDGGDIFAPIESEELLNKIFDIYLKAAADEFGFDGDGDGDGDGCDCGCGCGCDGGDEFEDEDGFDGGDEDGCGDPDCGCGCGHGH